ncbi:delta-1-pyrroline-5-carboxylate dehydrogenase, mitochondrial [Glossina fuscipes]|uniref:Multifunctional fusion protein n=1 Tax=Glossina fuscipes TaxID=7396 RepID=A0A9C5Z935_9MUSC|nr:delta-1-pyrroline-5-carboxylate dehydrogenase, mitochondrial [Glossina fuscipes]
MNFSVKTLSFIRNFSTAIKNVKSSKQTNLSVIASNRFDSISYTNEPVLQYRPLSKEQMDLERALVQLQSECSEIPIIVGGKTYKTEKECYQVLPHKHCRKLAKFYHADEKILQEAIESAVEAQRKWDFTNYNTRFKIWEKAANLMATKYRALLVAATMLGQSKTVFQAEIDAAAELIDFIRLNAQFCKKLLNYRPTSVDILITQNHFLLRGLGGFVAAISPFNFTAIGGNLAYTPALMGNAVLWKPADTAMLSSWLIFKIMREAGVPDGVVNFVPADGPTFGKAVTSSTELAGINFTGSVPTFKTLWKMVSDNLDSYKYFPRLSGECGGKNFHFVHPSADVDTVIAATIRSAFEYSGQKCSACSRLYVPASLWDSKIRKPLCEKTDHLILGDVSDYKTFLAAVIDEKAFKRISTYIIAAKSNPRCHIIAGGKVFDSCGYFIEPTILLLSDIDDPLLKQEIFGPVLSVYVYKDADMEKTIDLLTSNTPYALTGSVFATDETFIKSCLWNFRHAVGNFYINDKSTGAVVGQQPFGGGKMSGTNDKPGSPFYLLRWTSPISIKETFVPQHDIYYPYMAIPTE